MSIHFVDSLIYKNAWGTEELRDLFAEENRTRTWLELLAILAETQADFGIIPLNAAQAIAETCQTIELTTDFFEEVRRGFEESNHSMLGLIQAVQRRCPEQTGEWFYYGITVQDITDTWMMLSLQKVIHIVNRELAHIETHLLRLASTYRDTIMPGRTHGQIGLPITFGYKAAIWATEIRRHRQRLDEITPRMKVGQLAGGVGSLSAFGSHGLALQQRFLERVGLQAPLISWTNARDVLVEWFHLLVLIASTGDKIGHEIYNLQRSEIGEVCEGFVPGTVGSITMPHKSNPEMSEHIGTLSRLIRSHTSLLSESLVHDHERDGRSWKVEWSVLPENCLSIGKLLNLLSTLLSNLQVHPARMRENLEAAGDVILSEALMLALSRKIGKQSAHHLVYELVIVAHTKNRSLKDMALQNTVIRDALLKEEIIQLFDFHSYTGLCKEMIDCVLTEMEKGYGHE